MYKLSLSIIFIAFTAFSALAQGHNHDHGNDSTVHFNWGLLRLNFTFKDAASSSIGTQGAVDLLAESLLNNVPKFDSHGLLPAKNIGIDVEAYDNESNLIGRAPMRWVNDSLVSKEAAVVFKQMMDKLRAGSRLELRNISVDDKKYAAYFGAYCMPAQNGSSVQGGLFRLVSCYLQFGGFTVQTVPQSLADSVNWYKPVQLSVSALDSLFNKPRKITYMGVSNEATITHWSFVSTDGTTLSKPTGKAKVNLPNKPGTLRLTLNAGGNTFYAIVNFDTDKNTFFNIASPSAEADNIPLKPKTFGIRSAQKDPIVQLGEISWPLPGNNNLLLPLSRNTLIESMKKPLTVKGPPIVELTWVVYEAKASVLMPFATGTISNPGMTPIFLDSEKRIVNLINRQSPGAMIFFFAKNAQGEVFPWGVELQVP